MIDLVDLKEIRYGCSDVADLQALLKQLIGQPFQFFRVAYGDELRLHLGTFRDYANSKLRNRPRGSYVIGARASSWMVASATKSVLLASDNVQVRAPEGSIKTAKQVDIKKIEGDGYITPGAVVVGVMSHQSPHGFTLQLAFADGSTAFAAPNPETYEYVPDGDRATDEVAEMEISDWEILTPHSRVLRVGPGARWCYVDSSTNRNRE